ncbi:unnamed protein product [Sphagnum balticum]
MRGSASSRLQQSAMAKGSNLLRLLMVIFSVFACLYTAGRLWQDAEMWSLLVEMSEQHVEQEDRGRLSVDEQLKLLDCKDQEKKLAELEMELSATKSQGFGPMIELSGNASTGFGGKLLAVVGIMTSFGNRSRRESIRKTWPEGSASKKLEDGKGVVIRFVIGRSANRGDMSDCRVDLESTEMNDFLILNNHVEGDDSLPMKTKLFFSRAAESWDAHFYVKVDDDVFVDIDKLGTMLASHLKKPRVYVGCMKSGEVVSDVNAQWYEPEWWRFGEEKSQYYRHASGQLYGLSRALALYISINSASLREYRNEDVSVGGWMLGLDMELVDDRSLCCSLPVTGGICTTPTW